MSKKNRKAEKAEETKAAAPKKTEKERRPCACGCGESTTNTFVSGHDGRVHGWFRSVQRGDFLPEGLRTEQLRVAFSRWDGTASVRAAFVEPA